jgi:nucleoid-associated protein YgaU
MPPIVRILLVAGVLASGLGIASLFKKAPTPAVARWSDSNAVRHPDAPQVVLGPAQSAYGLAPPGPLDVAPPSVALTDGSRSGPSVVDSLDRPPPMLPLRSPLSSGPYEISEPGTHQAPAARRPETRDQPSGVHEDRVETNTQATRHRIVDGDTLEGIAQRYWGDRARWSDVYQHNRDVLAAPNALPIGVELRIPPRPSLGVAPSEPPVVPLRRIRP